MVRGYLSALLAPVRRTLSSFADSDSKERSTVDSTSPERGSLASSSLSSSSGGHSVASSGYKAMEGARRRYRERIRRLGSRLNTLARGIGFQRHSRVTAATETSAAIEAEWQRLQSLSAAEVQEIGGNFTRPEAIFDALELAGGEATVLLRASWLRRQRGHGARLPKRGSSLPPSALISAAELRAIYAAARGRVGRKHASLPLIAVSHMWRSKEHPDPDGQTLRLLVEALDARWEEFESFGVADVGIFLDFCSLWQAPRTEEQTIVFGESLRAINLWYAHQHTTVWVLSGGGTASAAGVEMSYHDKGWYRRRGSIR